MKYLQKILRSKNLIIRSLDREQSVALSMSKIILTTVISLNPVKTKFLRSSHPIPPAPTTRILAVLTLVPSSDSNTGFDILERILPCLIQNRIKSKTIVKLIFQYFSFWFSESVCCCWDWAEFRRPAGKEDFSSKVVPFDVWKQFCCLQNLQKDPQDFFSAKNLQTTLSRPSETFLSFF